MLTVQCHTAVTTMITVTIPSTTTPIATPLPHHGYNRPHPCHRPITATPIASPS